ncbi:DUF6299 family protein [Dactylosporangium sp. McL0621]|uniref:DUF6299 family protein n=1 Tax=Dactylosporangium sp. McL0621 TaxID=3415678 RepID=UPI003CE674C8
MRFAKRLSVLALAGLPATALTIGVSAPAAHAQTLPEVTINPTGSVSKTGDVTISGTFKCPTGTATLVLDGLITQHASSGLFNSMLVPNPNDRKAKCDGRVHPWSSGLYLTAGRFKAGDTTVVATGYYGNNCQTGPGCSSTPSFTQTVRLKQTTPPKGGHEHDHDHDDDHGHDH